MSKIHLLLCNTDSRRLRPEAEQARSRIIAIAQSHAGIRYSEPVRMMNLAHGTLSHHIKILQRQGRIRVRRDSGSTRLFPKNYDEELCNAIASASYPTTLAIIVLLMRYEYAGYCHGVIRSNRGCHSAPYHIANSHLSDSASYSLWVNFILLVPNVNNKVRNCGRTQRG